LPSSAAKSESKKNAYVGEEPMRGKTRRQVNNGDGGGGRWWAAKRTKTTAKVRRSIQQSLQILYSNGMKRSSQQKKDNLIFSNAVGEEGHVHVCACV
jgi:hypothetical protein